MSGAYCELALRLPNGGELLTTGGLPTPRGACNYNWHARTRDEYEALYGPWPGTRPSARYTALGPILGPWPDTRPLVRQVALGPKRGPWPEAWPLARSMPLGPDMGIKYGLLPPKPTPSLGAGSKTHPSVGLERAKQTWGRESLLTQLNDRGLLACARV